MLLRGAASVRGVRVRGMLGPRETLPKGLRAYTRIAHTHTHTQTLTHTHTHTNM